jgi:hypothetical protein
LSRGRRARQQDQTRPKENLFSHDDDCIGLMVQNYGFCALPRHFVKALQTIVES